MKVAWEYTFIDAIENIAHYSYALNTIPRSQTHTSLEAADSPPSLELNATIAHFDFYYNSYENRMEDVGPSCVRT